MKKLFFAFMLCTATLSYAAEGIDTTSVMLGKNKVVIHNDSLGISVSIFDSEGHQWKKTREVNFVDGQEVEQVFVFSPFIPLRKNTKRTFYPHFPDFYYGANLLNTNNNVVMRDTKSSEWGFSPCQIGLSLNKQNTLGLVSSLQFGFVHNHFNTSSVINRVEEETRMLPLEEKDVTTSFLKYYYVKLPIMVEWQKRIGRRKIFAGGGLALEYRYKEVSKYRIGKQKHTVSRDLGINALGINAEAYVGYGSVNLYAHYALTPLFKKGINAMPFGVGIGINM